MATLSISLGEVVDASQQFANGYQELQSNPLDGVIALSQVATTLYNFVAGNPLFGQVIGASLNIFALEREFHKLEAELRKPSGDLDY